MSTLRALPALLLLAGAARAQTAEQTIDKAAAAYGKMRTAHVVFSQTVTNPLTNKAVSSKGDLLERLPGHYLVTFTVPAGDKIVSDGRVVWVYLPSTNPGQVLKLPVGEGGASRVPDFTAYLLDDPKAHFTLSDAGTATIAGRATHIVQLIPKDKTAPFAAAKLWIDDEDGIVRQFETADANGSLRHVRIEKIEMNVPAAGHLFTFTPPAGVKVFEPGS